MNKTVKVIIAGRVQGVGFRYWTIGRARRLGLHGWVRNRSDGSVEALFSGEESLIEKMIKDCGTGPIGADVEAVKSKISDEKPGTEFCQKGTL